jgi:hypothetical protein
MRSRYRSQIRVTGYSVCAVFFLAGWHSASDDPGQEAEVQIHRL